MSTALATSEATLEDILEPRTVLFMLASTDARPPGIQVFWNREANNIVLHAFALDPAPSGREYQLWFLHAGDPVPASTFNSGSDGHRLITVPGPSSDLEITGAAVTIEPLGGSTVPTPPILLVGFLAPDP